MGRWSWLALGVGAYLAFTLATFPATVAVRWRIRPWSLLLGRLAGTVEARIPDGFVSTELTATSSRVRFDALRGATTLSALAAILPVSGMRGQASVTLSTLEIDDGWPSRVVGELRLAGLEVAPFVSNGTQQLLALGDYTVTFADAPERGVAASFVDNGGPLEVSGTLAFDAAHAYTLDALIEPRAGAPEQLVEGLKIMTAEPDAEGRRRLTLTGSL